ncbi:MAG: type II secretion system protein [Akkermansia muciniphila]|nr:prepilin-type N-terminal cleavage/methylation domain-containing protein [Akkermansia muciniphila]
MKAPKIYRKKGGFTLIELIVVIAILGTLAAVGYGPIMDHLNDGDRQIASSNLSNISTALIDFNTEVTGYPSDETAEQMQTTMEEAGKDFGALQGNNSNCYFRQLMVRDGSLAEKIFFAKVKGVTAEGDNKKANGKALQAGENAFSYVMMQSTDGEGYRGVTSRGACPIVMTPTRKSAKAFTGADVEFDLTPFRGHVFVLYTDKSIKDFKGDKQVKENEDDDTIGTLAVDIFPENAKTGESKADRYTILGPDLK